MSWYFSFGANMNTSVLERRQIPWTQAHPARLLGHRLVFDVKGFPLLEPGFANLAPAVGQTVHGVLYKMLELDLERLGSFEGEDYDACEREVIAPWGPVGARIYLGNDARPGLVPSRRYLALLCAGAQEHGLPQEWIDELAAHPSAYVPVLSELVSRGFSWIDGMQRRLTPDARR